MRSVIVYDGTAKPAYERTMGPGNLRTSYPERLRHSLEASRRQGLGFEPAWTKALKVTASYDSSDIVPCTSYCNNRQHNCKWLREIFRDGYLRIGHPLMAGIMCEDDDHTQDAQRVRPRRSAA